VKRPLLGVVPFDPIWGEATTGCACDSTLVSSWDQNLMSEWHPRYKERGIMIYWHVDTKSMVVHSQIKTCLSSEVGAMITGVLRHDTKMNSELSAKLCDRRQMIL